MDTRCHIDLGLIYVKRRVERYDGARVGMIKNQADKQKIWQVMKSWCATTLCKKVRVTGQRSRVKKEKKLIFWANFGYRSKGWV